MWTLLDASSPCRRICSQIRTFNFSHPLASRCAVSLDEAGRGQCSNSETVVELFCKQICIGQRFSSVVDSEHHAVCLSFQKNPS